jgi:hypothetical protein
MDDSIDAHTLAGSDHLGGMEYAPLDKLNSVNQIGHERGRGNKIEGDGLDTSVQELPDEKVTQKPVASWDQYPHGIHSISP